ncbi:MAG: hypothetical protein SPJ13_05280 [Bacteroidales bacterium]|nr:hypothetical protein [Bacteroidales bacterium]
MSCVAANTSAARQHCGSTVVAKSAATVLPWCCLTAGNNLFMRG